MPDYLEKFEKMRVAGNLAARTLDMLTDNIKPGVTTEFIDKLGYEFIRDNGAYSAPLFYRGFKKSLCTSLNHVVCHGIPSDIVLVEKNKQKIFVEVKNVTLFREEKTAEFPDAVTTRGSKHLKTLIEAVKKGYKSYLLFLVQIEGVDNFKIAKDIDKEYYENYLLAKKAGVIFLAYQCKISSKEIKIDKKIKIINV